jgi:hypothetical protein
VLLLPFLGFGFEQRKRFVGDDGFLSCVKVTTLEVLGYDPNKRYGVTDLQGL